MTVPQKNPVPTAATRPLTNQEHAARPDEWPIDSITVGPRHRKYLGDIPGLAASIAAVGLLHPVVVRPDGLLIAGERRVAAVRLLGRTTIPVRVLDLDDLLRAEADENAVRLDFAPSEAVAIGEALRVLEAERAKERRTANLPNGKVARLDKPGRVRDMVADAVGMSGRSYENAREVVEAAQADPEYGDLVSEMDRTGRVDPAYRTLLKRRIARRIEQEPMPFPTGPFRVIVADPPWQYGDGDSEFCSRQGLAPYPTMTLAEIAALPVESLAYEDAILWLWTTNAHLFDAPDIARAWGFEPKTILTWAKDRFGTGDWLRGQTEHCLMCVRGHPTHMLTNQTTLLNGPVREHSRKPDEFFRLVESLCPGSKVELFAREARPGWQAWGAEAAA
jgi:N6-adenosine-specific RNA methylase IME4